MQAGSGWSCFGRSCPPSRRPRDSETTRGAVSGSWRGACAAGRDRPKHDHPRSADSPKRADGDCARRAGYPVGERRPADRWAATPEPEPHAGASDANGARVCAAGRMTCLPRARRNRASASATGASVALGTVTVSFAGRGMQAIPPHHAPSRFLVLELAIRPSRSFVPSSRASGAAIPTSASSYAGALSSVALNLAEGNSSQGGHRIARFSTAAGSNSESRASLRVAVAWGYVPADEIAAGDELLDRVAAMLHRLGAKR